MRLQRAAAALTLLITAAACNSGTDVDDELTQLEAQALAEVVARTVVTARGQAGTPQAAPAQATYQQSVEFVAPCPLGGSVRVAGDVTAVVDDETQAKIDDVKQRLIKQFGYNENSATDVLNYVASIFARGDKKSK